MGSYTKIKHITLYDLNNAEYLAFLNSVLNLVPAPTGGGDRPEIESLDADVRTNGSPDIGLSAQFVQKMENDVMLLADTVDESRIAQETEQAAVHEANRDNLVIYITTRISRAGTPGNSQNTRPADRPAEGRKRDLRHHPRTGSLPGRTRKGKQRLHRTHLGENTEPRRQ